MWLYNQERPNMAIDGIKPKMKLAMAALALLSNPVKNGWITVEKSGIGQPQLRVSNLSSLL